jgi:uncharacterized protein (DUF1697 family)
MDIKISKRILFWLLSIILKNNFKRMIKMYNHCVFFRGINVNGIKIKMNDLKKAFETIGYKNPKTVLATGNVLIHISNEELLKFSIQNIKELIENKLSDYFKYELNIIIKNKNEIRKIANLDVNSNKESNLNYYLIIVNDKSIFLELDKLYKNSEHFEEEKFFVYENDFIWIVPKGKTLEGEFGSKLLGKSKYKSKLTSRNLNTIEKIYNFMK